MDLVRYSKGITKRLFEILDRTKEAIEFNDDKKLQDVEKMMDVLSVEIKGSLTDFETLDRGFHLHSVANLLNGLKTITDYNVRRKVIKDCLSIVHRVTEDAKEKFGGGDNA